MFKLNQDEPLLGCCFCMSISKLEFYGSNNNNQTKTKFPSLEDSKANKDLVYLF